MTGYYYITEKAKSLPLLSISLICLISSLPIISSHLMRASPECRQNDTIRYRLRQTKSDGLTMQSLNHGRVFDEEYSYLDT